MPKLAWETLERPCASAGCRRPVLLAPARSGHLQAGHVGVLAAQHHLQRAFEEAVSRAVLKARRGWRVIAAWKGRGTGVGGVWERRHHSAVIPPHFPLDLTGFFSGKQAFNPFFGAQHKGFSEFRST